MPSMPAWMSWDDSVICCFVKKSDVMLEKRENVHARGFAEGEEESLIFAESKQTPKFDRFPSVFHFFLFLKLEV